MMKDLCIPLESLDAEFRIIDVNGDFRISFEEFYGWYIKKNLWESPIRRLGMMVRFYLSLNHFNFNDSHTHMYTLRKSVPKKIKTRTRSD
jgi:hypothetical protein